MEQTTRTMTINGQAKKIYTPEIFVITLRLTAIEKTYQEAVAKNDQNIAIIKDIVKRSGLEDNLLKVRYIYTSEHTCHDYDNKGKTIDRIDGFQCESSFSIELERMDPRVSELLDNLATAQLQYLSYFCGFDLADKEKKKNEVMKLAVKDAILKAKDIAGAARVKLGPILNIEYHSGSHLSDSLLCGGVNHDNRAEPEGEEIEDNVTITFLIQDQQKVNQVIGTMCQNMYIK